MLEESGEARSHCRSRLRHDESSWLPAKGRHGEIVCYAVVLPGPCRCLLRLRVQSLGSMCKWVAISGTLSDFVFCPKGAYGVAFSDA